MRRLRRRRIIRRLREIERLRGEQEMAERQFRAHIVLLLAVSRAVQELNPGIAAVLQELIDQVDVPLNGAIVALPLKPVELPADCQAGDG